MYENRNIKKDVVILEIRNNSAYIHESNNSAYNHESRLQTQLPKKPV